MKTVFEAAGGNDGLRRLAHAWHKPALTSTFVNPNLQNFFLYCVARIYLPRSAVFGRFEFQDANFVPFLLFPASFFRHIGILPQLCDLVAAIREFPGHKSSHPALSSLGINQLSSDLNCDSQSCTGCRGGKSRGQHSPPRRRYHGH